MSNPPLAASILCAISGVRPGRIHYISHVPPKILGVPFQSLKDIASIIMDTTSIIGLDEDLEVSTRAE